MYINQNFQRVVLAKSTQNQLFCTSFEASIVCALEVEALAS